MFSLQVAAKAKLTLQSSRLAKTTSLVFTVMSQTLQTLTGYMPKWKEQNYYVDILFANAGLREVASLKGYYRSTF